MNTRRKGALAALILLLTCSYAAAHAEFGGSDAGAVVRRTAKGPALTGDLSDPAWKNGGFRIAHKYDGSGEAAQKSDVQLAYDSECLYIGVRCHEPRLSALTAQTKDRDGEVWTDDSIEILIDTANAHHACYHFIVNSVGALYDEKCLSTERADASWNSNARIKTGRVEGAWIVEMAIPFKDFGVIPTPGLIWGMNICRSRFVGERELTAWSHTPEGFVRPKNFHHIVFCNVKCDPLPVRVLSWGNLDPNMTFGGENVLRCTVCTDDKPLDLEVALTSELKDKFTTVGKRKVSVEPKNIVKLDIPYSPSGSPDETFQLTVTSGNTIVFRATHPSMAMPQRPRVWQLTDPLFTELLSKNPPGLQKNGAIYWFHSGVESVLRPHARIYGLRYCHDEAFKELADHKLMPIVLTHQLQNEDWIGMAAKHGVKALFEPDYRKSRDKGAPQIDGLPFILDPRSRETYFADLKTGIDAAREHIWAIYTYDELHEKAGQQGVRFFAEQKDTYPFIKYIDDQVKKEFGYGKYGLPESPDDENPFRWIAYRKWINKRLLEWQKDVYDYVRRNAPELKVISMDPVAGHKPYELDRISPYVDIVTHQLYPSGNPNRQEFGFVTKFVADLTGKPVWPCAHVENYAYSTTAEEIRELMSQVMRNGGKGFHLYLPDVRGGSATTGDTELTKIGCPERYRAVTEILSTVRSMNEVALPMDPDCAILYSEDHYQSFPAKNYVYPNEPEFAYTFLGPVARTWFSFINDNMVADGKDLSKYKAIFVPAAKYERRVVVEKLLEYAEKGGALVLGSPECFSFAPDGSSLADLQKKLTACKSVITYPTNPFTEANIDDEKRKAEFKKLAKDLHLKTDRDIWRFKFPEFKTVYQPDPTGRCLTGNYIKWHQERPLDILNVSTGGSYTYGLAPDAVADRSRDALTDRKLAPTVKKADLRPEDFVASWKTEQPTEVTFDFREAYPMSRVRLWYSDQLPALTVEGSTDGKEWVRLAEHPKQAPTKDVLDVKLKVQGSFRYVRLSFGPRDVGQMMTLVECEVWAE